MRAIIGGLAAASLALGCGGSGNTCEDAIANAAKIYGFGGASYANMRKDAIQNCKDEKWSDQLRACAAAAKTRSDFDACEKYTKEGRGDRKDQPVAEAKRTEAEINLDAIKKSLKVAFIENAAYPIASTPLTPPTSCCNDPSRKCQPNPKDWMGNAAWDALDFEMTDAGYFQYSYESTDGQRAIATAVGDLDCDGNTITYTLEATATGGNPVFTLTKPERAD